MIHPYTIKMQKRLDTWCKICPKNIQEKCPMYRTILGHIEAVKQIVKQDSSNETKE